MSPPPPLPNKSLRAVIPSFVPTSQVVKLQTGMNKIRGLFTPTSTQPTPDGTKISVGEKPCTDQFITAKDATALFPVTTPEVDGEECLHDCDSCTVALPRKWEIDETDTLYGHVKGWDYHVIVATGKSDWVRDVIDEKGSLMESMGVHGLEVQPTNTHSSQPSSKRRKVMLSASNMPSDEHEYANNGKTNVILLPAWKYVEGVTQADVPWFMAVVASGPSNLNHLPSDRPPSQNPHDPTDVPEPPQPALPHENNTTTNTNTSTGADTPDPTASIPPGIQIRALHHRALILLCSHKTRDARCGQSAPLLRRELERHLRPLGLYRDLHDDRPGGVGIYFINHVGGHKYSANMMVYRRSGSEPRDEQTDQAVQGIWLARVRPEDCENIVRYTVLMGKVVKPLRQLRGGFDRSVGLSSW